MDTRDVETGTDTGTDPRPLTPDARARPGAAAGGTPVTIAGQDWHLAAFVPRAEALWDRLFDANHRDGRYDEADVRRAAFRLLYHNYDLSPGEGVGLAAAAPVAELVRAAETALFGGGGETRSYSDWVSVSLLANGIDPRSVPPERLRGVLALLVSTGRAPAAADSVTSALLAREAAAVASVRDSFRAMVAPASDPAPAADPEPGPADAGAGEGGGP